MNDAQLLYLTFFLSHRPINLQNQGYVYMSSLKVARGDVWYNEVKRDGVNYISKFMVRMIITVLLQIQVLKSVLLITEYAKQRLES